MTDSISRALSLAKTKADGGSISPRNIFNGKIPEPENGYVYHATNHDRLHDILETGSLKTHRPNEFTDQSSWPDGKKEKRSYFSEKPETAKNFAPEEGIPVLLRTKKKSHMHRESTGDIFSKIPIHAHEFDYLHEKDHWQPLVKKGKANGGTAQLSTNNELINHTLKKLKTKTSNIRTS